MKNILNTIVLATAFALAVPSFGAQAGAAKQTAAKATTDAKKATTDAKKATTDAKKATTEKKAAMTPPTDAEIAAAKARGDVWVNTASKIYHKDGANYGKTKQGKFMSAAEADKAGYRAAKESPIGKKKTTAK